MTSNWTLALYLSAAAGGGTPPATWQPSSGHVQVPIWPGTPPDGRPTSRAENTDGSDVQDVTLPTMTVYSARGATTHAAVIVFPGGGYRALAMDIEGTEVCDWLTAKGITCVLLKYRVPGNEYYPGSGPTEDEDSPGGCRKSGAYPCSPIALEDAQRTLGLVRARASEWQVDPHKIGVLGFSAGGHLAVAVSTHWVRRVYAPIDGSDQESCRPDFAVVLYPGHLWRSPFELNSDIRVTDQTPPQFILQAEDDPVDDVENSLVYYRALKRNRVPAEIHLYAHGGHAFGLRATKLPITQWPRLVETWLEGIGIRQ